MILSNTRRLRHWGAIRRQGMPLFIIVNGMLGYGLLGAALGTLCMWAFSSSFDASLALPVALLVFPLVGMIVAWRGWRDTERKYKTIQAQLSAA